MDEKELLKEIILKLGMEGVKMTFASNAVDRGLDDVINAVAEKGEDIGEILSIFERGFTIEKSYLRHIPIKKVTYKLEKYKSARLAV